MLFLSSLMWLFPVDLICPFRELTAIKRKCKLSLWQMSLIKIFYFSLYCLFSEDERLLMRDIKVNEILAYKWRWRKTNLIWNYSKVLIICLALTMFIMIWNFLFIFKFFNNQKFGNYVFLWDIFNIYLRLLLFTRGIKFTFYYELCNIIRKRYLSLNLNLHNYF